MNKIATPPRDLSTMEALDSAQEKITVFNPVGYPPKIAKKSGRVFSSWGLSEEYGFCDADGRKPHWGNHAKKKYGDVMKPCDEGFYQYWMGGMVDSIFPNWP